MPATLTKQDVNYRKDDAGTPCSACGNFISPANCSAVEGNISPTATCDLFKSSSPQGTVLSPEDLINQYFGGQNG